MATRQMVQAGNWNDPNTWFEEEVPTAEDDVICAIDGLNINISDATCNTLDLTSYPGYLSFENGAVLTIVTTIYLVLSSGLVLANPVDKIIFQSSYVSVWYDGDKSVAEFDNGSGIFIIAYI